MPTRRVIAKKDAPAKRAAPEKTVAAKHTAPAGKVNAARESALSASEPTERQLQAAFETAVKSYAHRPNVTGVDVGFRYKDGKRLASAGVRIHVAEKLPPSQLEAGDLFPEHIDGVPVDVIQAVYKPHAEALLAAPEPDAHSRKMRIDPIQPGVSVSHPNVTSGTLGAVVYDRATGMRGILSNWHVLVGSLEVKPGDPVIQPGRKWGGRAPRDQIGSVERFLLDTNGDAAVALLNGSRGVDAKQFETGTAVIGARKVKRGELVEKSGATTGVTRGCVDGEGQYTLDYAVGRKTIFGFKIVAEDDGNPQQLEVSSGGDSGALWYAVDDKMGVGLHFAGETDPRPTEEHALACHLPVVLEQLNLSLQPITPVVSLPVKEMTSDVWPVTEVASAEDRRIIIETVGRLTRLLEAAVLTPKI